MTTIRADNPLSTSLPQDFGTTNPFAARFLDPARANWIEPVPSQLESWTTQLLEGPRIQTIVGPHGCGKSTLLHTLCSRLAERRATVNQIWIAADRTPWNRHLRRLLRQSDGESFAAVDGLDAWPLRQRRALKSFATRRNLRVVATLHTRDELPLLADLQPDFLTLTRIVERLTSRIPPSCHPDCKLLQHLFSYHRGNLRDVLFDLYDWWEAGRGKHEHRVTLPPSLLSFPSP